MGDFGKPWQFCIMNCLYFLADDYDLSLMVIPLHGHYVFNCLKWFSSGKVGWHMLHLSICISVMNAEVTPDQYRLVLQAQVALELMFAISISTKHFAFPMEEVVLGWVLLV